MAVVRGLFDAGEPLPTTSSEHRGCLTEQLKASARAKVERPYRVIKQQGHAKVRYRGLANDTAWRTMLFALSKRWIARRQFLRARG